MYYNIKDFPFLKKFVEGVADIKEELIQSLNDPLISSLFYPNDKYFLEHYTNYWASDNGFHSDQIGYDIRTGEFHTLTIYKKDFPIKYYDVHHHFPKTMEMLKEIPNLYFSAFFNMESSAKLDAHSHSRRHLIFHVLLNNLEEGACVMNVNGEERNLQKQGDYVIFDYSKEHSSANLSSTDRYNLVIDFNPFN